MSITERTGPGGRRMRARIGLQVAEQTVDELQVPMECRAVRFGNIVRVHEFGLERPLDCPGHTMYHYRLKSPCTAALAVPV